jgi:hypothetical protein
MRGGFVLGASPVSDPSAHPTLTSASDPNPINWFNTTFEPQLAIISYNYSRWDTLWGIGEEIVATVDFELAPGVSMINASLDVEVFNSATIISSSHTFTGWVASETVLPGPPRNGLSFLLESSESALPQAKLQFRCTVPQYNADSVSNANNVSLWLSKPTPKSLATLKFQLERSDGSFIPITVSSLAPEIWVRNMRIGYSTLLVSQDNLPTTTTGNDQFLARSNLQFAPITSSNLTVQTVINEHARFDVSRSITLKGPISFFEGTGSSTQITLTIPYDFSYTYTNTATQETALVVDLMAFLSAHQGRPAVVTGPLTSVILDLPINATEETPSDYLAAGDVIFQTTSLFTDGHKIDSDYGYQTVASGFHEQVISHVDGLSYTGTPVLQQDATVTYRMTYVALGSWKNLGMTIFLPYPLLRADAAVFYSAIISTDASPPPIGNITLGSLHNASLPTYTIGRDRVDFFFGSYFSEERQATAFQFYMTLKVGRTHSYKDRDPVSSVFQISDNVVHFSTARTALVGAPELHVFHGVFATDSTLVKFADNTCPYCYSSMPAAGNCAALNFSPAQLVAIDARLDPDSPLSKPVRPFANLASELQSGDTILFVTFVPNWGNAGAINFRLKSILPAGLEVPSGGLDLCTSTLSGAAVEHTGASPMDTDGIFYPKPLNSRFAITAFSSATTTDVIKLSYRLKVSDDITAGAIRSSQYSICFYNDAELATATCIKGDTLFNVSAPNIASLTASTSIGNTLTKVQIGQYLTIDTVFTIPGALHPNMVINLFSSPSPLFHIVNSSIVQFGPQTGSSLSVGSLGALSSTGLPSVFDSSKFEFGTFIAGRAVPHQQLLIRTVVQVPDLPAYTQGSSMTFNVSAQNFTRSSTATALTFNVVEPAVSFTAQSLSISTGDANDEVLVTVPLTFPSSGLGDIYQLRFASHFADATALYTLGSFSAPVGFHIVHEDANGFAVQLNGPVLAGSAPMSVTWRCRIAPNVVTSSIFNIYTNVTWSSVPYDGGRLGTLTHQTQFTVASPTVSFTLESSNVTQTPGNQLAISEAATYLFSIRFPEGVTTDLRRVVFMLPTTGPQILQLAPFEQKLSSIGSNLVGSPWTVGQDAIIDGQNLIWNLSSSVNITNNFDDAVTSSDTMSFTVTVYPLNNPAIVNGMSVNLMASASMNTQVLSQSNQVIIREPAINLVSQISNVKCRRKGGLQAGCEITNTILIQVSSLPISGFNGFLHVNTSELNDIRISSITIVPSSQSAEPGLLLPGGTTTKFEASFANLNSSQYNVSFVTVLGADLPPGAVFGFSAYLTYDSVPGATNPIVPRHYRKDTGFTLVTYTPLPVFTVESTGLGYVPQLPITSVPPGEFVLLNLTIPFLEGHTDAFVDITLPPWAIFESAVAPHEPMAYLQHVGANLNLTGAVNVLPGTQGNLSTTRPDSRFDRASFYFGRVSAIGEEDDLSACLVIFLAVRVDAAAASAGQSANATALVDYVKTASGIASLLSIRLVDSMLKIVEPLLLTNATSVIKPTGDAGDQVLHLIQVKPASSNPGTHFFDVSIPISVSFQTIVAGSVIFSASSGVTLATASLDPSTVLPGTSALVKLGKLQMGAGSTFNISFTTIIDDVVTPGQVLVSSYTASWYSTNYTHANATLNKAYQANVVPFHWTTVSLPPTDSLVVFSSNVPEPTFVPAYSKVPIGATVTFRRMIQLIEGKTTLSVTFQASTAVNKLMRLISANVILGPLATSNVPVTGVTWTLQDTNGDSINDFVLLNLGTITNAPDNDATNDYVMVDFTVVILNTTASINGATMTVHSAATKGGFVTNPSATVTIIEPILTSVITSSALVGDAGDIIPLEARISHTAASQAHAHSVIIMLNFPPQLKILPSWSSTATPAETPAISDSEMIVKFTQFDLSAPEIVISFTAEVQQGAHPGASFGMLSKTTHQSTSIGTDFRLLESPTVTTTFQMLVAPMPPVTSSFLIQPVGLPIIKIGQRAKFIAKLALVEASFTDFGAGIAFSSYFDVIDASVTALSPQISATGLSLGALPTSSNSSGVEFRYTNGVNAFNNLDPAADFVEFTVDAILRNDPAVARDTMLPISAMIFSEGSSLLPYQPYKVIEGTLTLTAVSDRSLVQGGTRVLHTITIAPSPFSNAPLYNLSLSVTLPVEMDINSAVSFISGPAASSSTQPDLKHFTIAFDSYDASTSLELRFYSMVLSTVKPAQSLALQYSLTYASVPEALQARVKTVSTTDTISAFSTPQGVSQSNFQFVGTQYDHQGLLVANVGENVTFSGQVALLNATYNFISINVAMPTLAGKVRMDIKELKITFVGPGVSGVSLSAVPSVSTGTSLRGPISTAATFTFNNVMNVADGADIGDDVIRFQGVAQVVYVDTTDGVTLTPTATYTSSVTTNHQFSISQVYTTPSGTLVSSITSNYDAGTLPQLTYTLTQANNAKNNWYNLQVSIDIPTQATFQAPFPTSSSISYSGVTITPGRAVITIPTWNSFASPLTIVYRVLYGLDVHPAQAFRYNVTTETESAPGSLQSVGFAASQPIGPYTARTTPTSPSQSTAFLTAQFQGQHMTATQLNIGETIGFRAIVPMIHGNYSRLALRLYAAASGVATPQFEIVSASVSALGPNVKATPTLSIGDGPVSTLLTAGKVSSALFEFLNISNAPDGVYNANDAVTVTGVARLLDIPATVTGSSLVMSAELQAESLTAVLRATATWVASDFSIVPSISSITHNVTTGQAGTGVLTTVTLRRQTSTGFGFNVSVLITHDDAFTLASNLKLSSSILTISSYNVVNSKTLNVTFDFVPAPSATTPTTITVITFESVITSFAVPTVTYNTQASYTAYTAPRYRPDARPSSGSFTAATFTVQSAPSLSSQPALAVDSTQYSHTVASTINVGEQFVLLGQIAFVRGTTPTSSIVMSLPALSGETSMYFESLKVDYIGPTITGTGLAIGQVPSTTTLDALGRIVSATFNFVNIVNTPPATDSGLEIVRVRAVARVTSATPVVDGVILSPAATFLPYVLPVGKTVSLNVLEGLVAISAVTNATVAEAGDVLTTQVTVSPKPLSRSTVYNLTIVVHHPSQILVGSIARFSSPRSARSVTAINANTLEIVFDAFAHTSPFTFSFESIVGVATHPAQSYTSRIDGSYNSTGDIVQARKRLLAEVTQVVTTKSSYQGLAPQFFAFGATEYTHAQAGQINIGETVQFNGQFALLQGTHSLVTLTVNMPSSGPTYLMSIESVRIDSFGAQVSGSNLAIGMSPSSTVLDASGNVIQAAFFLSNVVNVPDGRDDGDVIHFTGTARVLNKPENVAGSTLSPVVICAPEASSISVSNSIQIVEGLMTMLVGSDPVEGEAGTKITYSFEINHTPASTGTVYNYSLTLELGAVIDFPSQLDINTTRPIDSIVQVSSSVMTLVWHEIPKTAPLFNVQVGAVVKSSLTNSQTYLSHFTGVYNSSKTPVESRARKITAVRQLDAYTSPPGPSRSRIVFGASEFEHINPSHIRPGESVFFNASIGLIYATFAEVKIDIRMPLGSDSKPLMAIENAWIGYFGASISPLTLGTNSTSDVTTDGYRTTARFQMTNILNTPHGADDGTNVISVYGIARVLNHPENVDTKSLTVLADYVADSQIGTFGAAKVVVEPFLSLSAIPYPDFVQAGDQLSNYLAISHAASSTSSAHNMTLVLTLPPELDVVEPIPFTSTEPSATVTKSTDHSMAIWVPYLRLGDPVIFINVSATANTGIHPHRQYTNSFDMTWTSATQVQARSYHSSATNIFSTYSAPIGVSQPHFECISSEYTAHAVSSVVNVGESATFRATAALLQASFDHVYLTVAMPSASAGPSQHLMSIEAAFISRIGPGVTGVTVGTNATATVADTDGVASKVFFDLQNVVNGIDGLNGNDEIEIEVVARVLNVAEVVQGLVLVTSARISPEASDSNHTSSVTVSEGFLGLTAAHDKYLVQAGDIITSDVTIRPDVTSDGPVFNATVTITHPSYLSFVQPLQIVSPSPYVLVSETQQEVVIMFAMVDYRDGPKQFSIQSVVNSFIHPNTTHSTAFHLDYYSSLDHYQARVRSEDVELQITTHYIPQGLSQSSFSFALPNYSHNLPDTINIGETVAFNAQVALVFATHDVVSVEVSLPSGAQGAMAIESVEVSFFGSSISSPDLVLHAGPTATVLIGGHVTSATFTFTNVVCKQLGPDTGLNLIVISGVARVLDLPVNVRSVALHALASTKSEVYSQSFTDALTVVEGALTMQTSSSPASTDGTHPFLTTLSFLPTDLSDGLIYNLTVVVNFPPELLPINATATLPLTEVTITPAQDQLVLRFAEYNYLIGRVDVQFHTLVTPQVRPSLLYTANITVTYNSSKTAIESRITTLPASSSVTILTEHGVAPKLEISRQDISLNGDFIQLGETATYVFTRRFLSYTMSFYDVAIALPYQFEKMTVVSSQVLNFSAEIVGNGLVKGSSGVHSSVSGDGFNDRVDFHFTNVVSSNSDSWISVEVVALVRNDSVFRNGDFEVVASSHAENISPAIDTFNIHATLVTPILEASIIGIGSDGPKLEYGVPAPVNFTLSHAAISDGVAFVITSDIRMPLGVEINSSSFSYDPAWTGLVLDHIDENGFVFSLDHFLPNSEPLHVTFLVTLVDPDSQPGDLHAIQAYMDYYSSPVTNLAFHHAALPGGQHSSPSVIYDLETGFPTYNVSLVTEFNLNDTVVVVGERLKLISEVRLPSETLDLVFECLSPLDNVRLLETQVVFIGAKVTAAQIESPLYTTFDGRDVATLQFHAVYNSRGRSAPSGEQDIIRIETTFIIPDTAMNADGTELIFETSVRFLGGPQLRTATDSTTLRQPALQLLSIPPTLNVTILDPIWLPNGTGASPVPSGFGWDAGDLIVGKLELIHFLGSSVRAENTTLYMTLEDHLSFAGLTLDIYDASELQASYDFSDSANWFMLSAGEGVFPPTSLSKMVGIFIGTFQTPVSANFTYTLRVLETVETRSVMPIHAHTDWSSVADWEIGRSASYILDLNVVGSDVYVPDVSTLGTSVSTLKYLGDDQYNPLQGQNETAIGDTIALRLLMYLPEGTYNDFAVQVSFDDRQLAKSAKSADSMSQGFGATKIDFVSPSTSSIINMTDFMDNFSESSYGALSLFNEKLVVQSARDGHYVPFILHAGTTLQDFANVTRGDILAKPLVTVSWATGELSFEGPELVVVEPSLEATFSSSNATVAHNRVFTLETSINHAVVSDSVAYQVQVDVDLGVDASWMILTNVSFLELIGEKRASVPVNATVQLLSPTTARLYIAELPHSIRHPLVMRMKLKTFQPPPGVTVNPSVSLSYSSQPQLDQSVENVVSRTFSELVNISIYMDTAPQLWREVNIFTIYEHTFLHFYATDIFYDPDGEMQNSSLVVITPSEFGTSVVNFTDGSLLYTPEYYYYGNDSFVFTICDEFVVCSDALITIVVVPVVDPPILVPLYFISAQLSDDPSCTYPDCIGVSDFPIINDYSPDHVDLDPATFKLMKPLLYGSIRVETVPSLSARDAVAKRNQPTTNHLYYETYVVSSETLMENNIYEICDVRGICAQETLTIEIPGNRIRVEDPRISLAASSPKVCWPSYIFFGLSFVFGVRGPQSVNLMEHMADYEQFIAYSPYMSGNTIKPPFNYTEFTDCYQWTIINLPDFFKLSGLSKSTNAPDLRTDSLYAAFYANHIAWLVVGFIITMALSYLVLVPIALFVWDRLFHLQQISRTGKHWTTNQRLLYGLGTMLRYALLVYLPVTFWIFYVERMAPSIHIIFIAFSMAIPAIIFGFWIRRGDNPLWSNRWNALLYEVFNDFKPERMWWNLVVIGRHALIALFVGFVGNKLVSSWIVFTIKLVYLAAVIVIRPHSCYFSFGLDIVNHVGSIVACILFHLVVKNQISSNRLIGFHYAVMIIIVLGCVASTLYHLYQYYRKTKGSSKGHGKEESNSREMSAPAFPNGFPPPPETSSQDTEETNETDDVEETSQDEEERSDEETEEEEETEEQPEETEDDEADEDQDEETEEEEEEEDDDTDETSNQDSQQDSSNDSEE